MRELLDSRHEAIIKGSRLDEVFDVLMVHRSDRDTSVHASCIRCMWALARFDTVGLFVGPCISHLLAGIPNSNIRSAQSLEANHIFEANNILYTSPLSSPSPALCKSSVRVYPHRSIL